MQLMYNLIFWEQNCRISNLAFFSRKKIYLMKNENLLDKNEKKKRKGEEDYIHIA
jgi:hypothetical protein